MLALLLTVSLPWLYRRYQSSFVASLMTDNNLRGLVGPVELTIDNERIRESGITSTVQAPWSEIIGIDDGDEHIVIRVAPLIAILIPRRAFDTDDGRQEFLSVIRARLTARRS